ncbi:MAG TPA: phosphatase PAP2 family protein [Saprospiraceae bacterium]|nr:phosphatase PAP2 family protein [Saprospiraceae bacterium]
MECIQLDKQIFEWIVTEGRTSFLDSILPLCRDKLFWLPLYLGLVVYLVQISGKDSWRWILMIILTVTLSDQLSSNVLKNKVKRVRPCRDLSIKDEYFTLINCSGGYSFPSSHATNHMAIANFIGLSFASKQKRLKWILYVWALIVGFAQVYVGVHYPIDVVVGWLLGFMVGLVTYFLAQIWIKKKDKIVNPMA